MLGGHSRTLAQPSSLLLDLNPRESTTQVVAVHNRCMASGASEQLTVLKQIVAIFQDAGADYWLFGGWAVDFHAGRVTRDHDDLDFAVWLDDVPAIASRLANAGWLHRPSPDDDGGTAFARDGVRLELTYLVRGVDGEIYTPLREGRGRWSQAALATDTRVLSGIQSRVVALDTLTRSKSSPRADPDEAAKDNADAEILARLRRETPA
jgi:hypothetical protein